MTGDANKGITSSTISPGITDQESPGIDILMMITYSVICICGLLGNTSTCVVIARCRSMHTFSNYILFSLALSDLILIICGLLLEMYQTWYLTYPMEGISCIGLGLASETSMNATVLIIAAFMVERLITICHPSQLAALSKLSHVVFLFVTTWVLALGMAVPQAIHFGVMTMCMVKGDWMNEMLVTWGVVFFGMLILFIMVLYVLIDQRLNPLIRPNINVVRIRYRSNESQARVVRMLAAVALLFFICWAPFHVQRMLAIHSKQIWKPSDIFVKVCQMLTHISKVLYFLSTAINPILFYIMSKELREAFKLYSGLELCTELPTSDCALSFWRRTASPRSISGSSIRESGEEPIPDTYPFNRNIRMLNQDWPLCVWDDSSV